MKKNTWWRTIVSVIIALLHIIPIYITLVASVTRYGDFGSYLKIPKRIFLENFSIAFKSGNMITSFINTMIITGVSVAFIIFLGAMAAYPLSRSSTKFNRTILSLILAVMMIPALSLLVPLVTLVASFKGTSTYWAIILVQITFQLPLSIFLYANFIKTIPKELDEAATLDGCSIYMIFYRIILPLLKPVTATVVILTGVAVWNDYQFSLFFLQKAKMWTLPLAIGSFFGEQGSNPNVAAAAALMAILPLTILYIFLQKYFVQGMVDSAIK